MPSPRADSRGAYDVAVVGGGPAGAATALALRRADAGVRVALLERSDYSAFRAGETLPPPATRLLAALGVWESFSTCGAADAYGTRSAWGSGAVRENASIFSPYGRGWHVDRKRFDAWLAGEAERAGADVFRRMRGLPAARQSGVWTLMAIAEDGGTREIRARVLVDATGRHSRIARSCGARHVAVDGLIGVAVRLRVPAACLDSYTEVEAGPDGWWYSAALPDGHLLVMFMTDADLLRRTPWRTVGAWRQLAVSAPLTAARIADGSPLEPPTVFPAASQRLDICAGDAWLAAGDAASTVDPLSSQGILRALRSGIVTARAIRDEASGDPHALAGHHARMTREYEAYLDTRSAYYAMEQRWPESPFWRRRHSPVTATGAAHAIHVAYQHHEEPAIGQARRVHV